MTSKEFKTVADVMTRKIVTVTEQDALANLETTMDRLRFRHLPVVDDRGALVGLLSHRDLLHASSSFLSDKEAERNAIIHQLPVARVMERDVLTIHPGAPLTEAGKLLWESRIGCLPVVEADGRLIGIVTKSDFIRIALRLLGSDVTKPDVEELAKTTASV